MKLGSKPGLAAGLAVIAVAAAAPAALAGPTVRVRVEGASGTLLERTTVTLPDTPPPVASCPAGTAAAAIEVATGGNWDRAGFTQTILGETHDFSNNDYWAEWIDRGAGYQFGNGVCNDSLNSGDELLMLVDQPPYGEGSMLAEVPLELHAANAVRGNPVTVQVTGAVLTDFGPPAVVEHRAVPGATVAGGGASAVTGPDGRATLTFDRTGPVTLKASKQDTVVSGATTIQVVAPGEPVPPPPAGGSGSTPDRLAPLARLLGIADHQTFAKGKGPRTLKASVTDASGLAAVKLRLIRRSGGRCFYFSGRRQELERTRCGRAFFFKAGDGPDVSYLLPERLGAGRYVLDLAAVDRAGNRSALARGSTRVVFTVR
jgi:hypothetical protein